MDMQPPVQYDPMVEPAENDKKGLAIASLVIGIISLCAWIVPGCNLLLALVGVILGVLGLKSSKKTLSIIGLVLCGLILLLSICYSAGLIISYVSDPEIFSNLYESM